MRRDPRLAGNTEGLAPTAAAKCDAKCASESSAKLVKTAIPTRLRKDGSQVTSAFSNIS